MDHGIILFRLTNDYLFKGLMQRNQDTLKKPDLRMFAEYSGRRSE